MNRMNRRRMLGMSGAGALAAFLAACGKQAGVTESANIRALGVPAEIPGLSTEEVNDVVLLRTAASLEFTAIDAYEAALNLGVFTGSAAALRAVATRMRDDHRGHADAVNGLVVAAGGKAFECANPRFNEVYLAPALAAITAADNADVPGDVLALAHGLETVAAQTYQSVVGLLTTPAFPPHSANSRRLRSHSVRCAPMVRASRCHSRRRASTRSSTRTSPAPEAHRTAAPGEAQHTAVASPVDGESVGWPRRAGNRASRKVGTSQDKVLARARSGRPDISCNRERPPMAGFAPIRQG